MTLMRKCLKDYCQHTVVHNPEYLAIDAINMNNHSSATSNGSAHSSGGGCGAGAGIHAEYTYSDFLSENNLVLNAKTGSNCTSSNQNATASNLGAFSSKQVKYKFKEIMKLQNSKFKLFKDIAKQFTT